MKFKIPKIPKVELFGIDIIKNMMFFTLFVFIFLLLLAISVAPSIKKFKKEKVIYYNTKVKLDETQNDLDKILAKYQKLSKKNRRLILAMQREFDKTNFKNFASKYMTINNIQDKNISVYQKEFIKKTYLVSATIKTPINFYKFVDATKNYKNILKIYFPIVFKAKNGDIKLLFKLEHFKVK